MQVGIYFINYWFNDKQAVLRDAFLFLQHIFLGAMNCFKTFVSTLWCPFLF